METYLVNNKLESSSKETIDFIENMEKLFDIFNSSRSKKEQTNVTNRMKFINGWLVSITGLLLLWKDLKSTRSLNQQQNYVLYTARLNQDYLENLFCTLRQQNGNNTNPTPYQFLFAFTKFFLLNYFQQSVIANCINDLEAILTQMPTDSDIDISTLYADKTPFQLK
ncbi:THAP-type domain-containing protein, partial [Aphis craccivora]